MKTTHQNAPATLRQKQKAETRALILRSAQDLFEELGFEKTTMRKVAAHSGISPGAIFKHFENKSALLAASLLWDIDVTQEEALATVPKDASLSGKVLHVFGRFLDYYSVRPKLSKILIQHSLFAGGEWAEKFNNQSIQLVQAFAEMIDRGIKNRQIDKSTNSKVLATAFISHYLFSLILSCSSGDEMDRSVAMSFLEPLVNQAIAGASFRACQKGREHND